MSSLQKIKAEFVRIYEDIASAKGLPAVFGRIMAVLLLEGRELSHKEISDLTGYSVSSVSRTLNQMVRMGIVHRHKDVSLKHFVFHVSIDLNEMFANSLETMLKVYEAQREEMQNLTRKVSALKLKAEKNAEVNRLQALLSRFVKVMELSERIWKNAIRELRTL